MIVRFFFSSANNSPHSERHLVSYLLQNTTVNARPVSDSSNNVTIHVSLIIIEFLEINITHKSLDMIVWLDMVSFVKSHTKII